MPRDDNKYLVEDIEFLREGGVPAEQWPERVNRSPQALARALYRAGRFDLARPVGAFAQRLRYTPDPGRPCPQCSAPTRPGSTYCTQACWVASAEGHAHLVRAGQARAAQLSSPPGGEP